jgi:transcriptional regulator with XRE-family HTH domain
MSRPAEPKTPLGREIRAARMRTQGLTQWQVAEAVSEKIGERITSATIGHWELGTTQPGTRARAEALDEVLNAAGLIVELAGYGSVEPTELTSRLDALEDLHLEQLVEELDRRFSRIEKAIKSIQAQLKER